MAGQQQETLVTIVDVLHSFPTMIFPTSLWAAQP
jgi:hypothetical protein